MATLTDLHVLINEEATLKDLEKKLKDQLNRLRVEELALVNMIRSQQEVSSAAPSVRDDEQSSVSGSLDLDAEVLQELDLAVKKVDENAGGESEEESEVEEDEMEKELKSLFS